MTPHPMLQMREPPPEIDVGKPALPKRIRVDGYVVLTTPTTIEFSTVNDPNSWDVEPDPEREAPADGWIEWKGGECPVAAGTCISVKYRGLPHIVMEKKIGHDRMGTYWDHWNDKDDIIAYRVCK